MEDKPEFGYHNIQPDYANHDEAKRDIMDSIVGSYNSVRLHSTLDYCSPNRHEAAYLKQPA